MRTFQFPYLAGFDGARDSILDLRAVALASALVKSPSLETLILGLGNSFPGYLRQMVDAPSLKSINFTIFPHPERTSAGWGLPFIREDVDGDAKLKALVSYQELDDADQAELLENNRNFMSTNSDSDVEAYGSDEDVDGNYWSKNCLTYLHSLSELEKLGDTFGSTVKRLHVSSHAKSANIDLTPFTSLVSLSWLGTANQYSFAAPGSAVSTLPVLEELSVGGGNPLLLHLVKLPLDSLRTVELTEHGPGTMAFIRSHGTKLRELGVTTETIAEAAVFDVCASLNTLTIHPSWDGKSLEYMALTGKLYGPFNSACIADQNSLCEQHYRPLSPCFQSTQERWPPPYPYSSSSTLRTFPGSNKSKSTISSGRPQSSKLGKTHGSHFPR
ncbi:hypothetical protein MSAN_00571600 [Mycena sanguinolenta]|uniref:Uncharacterized protein n=1 Tax=Mycena sanguinolenta TaxID=230812 RepID=A0A8H6ZA36_9AGAR|nr:hypothetical protein MSAN_00571600 [Mycena sanguinolenta]